MNDPIALLDFDLDIDGPTTSCPACSRPMAPWPGDIEAMSDIIPHCGLCGVVLAA